MPSDDRLGLDDGQRLPPANPEPGEQHPEQAISFSETRFPGSSLEELKLMPQRQVLDSEGALRLKRRDQGADDGEKHGGNPSRRGSLTSKVPTRTEFVETTGGLLRQT